MLVASKLMGIFRRPTWTPAAMLISFGISVAGCGPHIPHSGKERADVVIKITYGGDPIKSGSVDLNNLQTGEGGGGVLDSTGTVHIKEVVLGDYIVTVQPPTAGALPGTDTTTAKNDRIAHKFQMPDKSPLKLTVPTETEEVTFDLKQ